MNHTSSTLHLVRKIIGFVLRHVRSKRISNMILWPIYRRIFGRGYEETISPLPGILMRVYGDMPDMVNKVLLFMSDFLPLAWEPVTSRIVSMLAPDIKTVVIAGSHLGYYPLLVASVNSNALIYAYEPDPINFERFSKNIAINRFSNIKVIKSALGNKMGEELMFFDSGQSSLIDTHRNNTKKGMVKIETLDGLCAREDMIPDLIILDAEGYEQHIIKGGRRTINSTHPDFIFEINPRSLHAAGSRAEGLCNDFISQGYTIFIIEDDYSHTMHCREITIKMSPYSANRLIGISFVNVYATMYPDRIKKYVNQR